MFLDKTQEYYDQGDGWRKTRERWWCLYEPSTSLFDLVEWLNGLWKVFAIMSTTRNIETEDMVINIKWKNGALGSVAVTMLTYPKTLRDIRF